MYDVDPLRLLQQDDEALDVGGDGRRLIRGAEVGDRTERPSVEDHAAVRVKVLQPDHEEGFVETRDGSLCALPDSGATTIPFA